MTLVVLCSALSVLTNTRTSAALPIGLLAAYAFAAERLLFVRSRPLAFGLAEALFAGATVAFTAGAESPMLPYLLAPALAVGLAGRRRDVWLVGAAATAGLVAGGVTSQPASLEEYVAAAAPWVLLGVALGLVAGWAQRLTSEAPVVTSDRYLEARSLLEDLRRVAHRLPGGLDVASSAEALLQSCADLVPSARSAVLVQPPSTSALVPAAVRGAQRVPWRAPLSAPGPLQRAWNGGVPVVDRRDADTDGRRRGSALAVLPILSAQEPFGLVILESYEQGAFNEVELDLLVTCLADRALRLETAVLFDDVRSTVTVEERGRLAREMHDGVAQELAYVGYQLDSLRGQASKVDPALAEGLSDVRTGLTRLISDIRLSITDLKTSVSSDRGLGAALTNYVRAVGSGQQVVVHVSLQESAFRLPGEQEVLLFQIAQAVAQDVRRSKQAANLWVSLEVDPPSARLLIEHDLPTDRRDLDLSDLDRQLSHFGGTLDSGPRDGMPGVRVEALLEGGEGGRTSAADR